jgi:hypothetical protein
MDFFDFFEKVSFLTIFVVRMSVMCFDQFWLCFMNLTVPISLDQQLFLHGKSYFWPKLFIQPPETQKTLN